MRATRYNAASDLGEHLPPMLARFCAAVPPVAECVPWPGKADADGYGKVSVLGRRGTVAAHRHIAEAILSADTRVCVCNVGVQECPVHPGRLMTQDEKIAFRKRWDERVVQE